MILFVPVVIFTLVELDAHTLFSRGRVSRKQSQLHFANSLRDVSSLRLFTPMVCALTLFVSSFIQMLWFLLQIVHSVIVKQWPLCHSYKSPYSNRYQ